MFLNLLLFFEKSIIFYLLLEYFLMISDLIVV